MATLAGVAAGATYEERLVALQRAGIGLWDVIGQCRRAGSLDSAIVRGSERPNALVPLIASLGQLRVIAFNGATAASLFRRHVEPQLPQLRQPVQRIALPSTSPAHAAMGLEALREAWNVLTPWREGSAHGGPGLRAQA